MGNIYKGQDAIKLLKNNIDKEKFYEIIFKSETVHALVKGDCINYKDNKFIIQRQNIKGETIQKYYEENDILEVNIIPSAVTTINFD
ncbi:hypothetical protein [Haloimpatiens massiliensis]|uniref:hypothetical protein n=1 Tax=Haloimpatiens massiliensis TaxID=1658110 RepID=UPI000C846B1B|nr:hypothetical protein [Haloimpatiens massiliensis]